MEAIQSLNKKKILAPKLRFKGFDEGWQNNKLGDIINNKSPKYNPEKAKESFKCIELEHLSTSTGELLGYIDSISSASIKNKFNEGDILFGKLRPYLRKYLRAPFEGVCSSEIWVLKGEKITNDFLYQIVQSDFFINLANQSTGSKMPRADWNVVASGIFHFPNLPEQQKIASFLSAVDEKIQQLTRKKELLEQYKKGVMQQLFSGKLRFKDENGKAFPGWEEKRLGDVCSFFSGGTPASTNKTFYSGTIPFIGSGNIYDSQVFSFITKEALDSSSAKIVEKGDLLYALYGANSGEVAISKIKGAINQAILCIRSDENIEYLYYVLLLNKDKIVAKYLQGGQGNLSANIIKRLKYKLPSVEEQEKIANYLSDIDNKIESVNKQITQTQTFKKGLLQQMFV
jgi:type I restriction enzyme S subunit